MRVLVALVLLTTMSIVVAQPVPPPVTNITLSADPTVIQKNEYSLLIAQVESEELNDRTVVFEIVSGANLADLSDRYPPEEILEDSFTNKTNESGIALAYLIAGSETGVVEVKACWDGTDVCSVVDVDIVESEYGVRLSTDEPIKNVNQSEVAQFSIIIKNIGLYTDNFSISVNAPPEVSWELNKNYFELPSGETDIIILNASSTQVGYYTITVTATSVNHSEATDSINLYLNVTKAPISPFPNCNNPPTDPDDDGLYEDTNGNGVMDLNDLFVLFTNMGWVEDNGYTPYFDFNGNEEMDVNDIFTLYLEIPT